MPLQGVIPYAPTPMPQRQQKRDGSLDLLMSILKMLPAQGPGQSGQPTPGPGGDRAPGTDVGTVFSNQPGPPSDVNPLKMTDVRDIQIKPQGRKFGPMSGADPYGWLNNLMR